MTDKPIKLAPALNDANFLFVISPGVEFFQVFDLSDIQAPRVVENVVVKGWEVVFRQAFSPVYANHPKAEIRAWSDLRAAFVTLGYAIHLVLQSHGELPVNGDVARLKVTMKSVEDARGEHVLEHFAGITRRHKIGREVIVTVPVAKVGEIRELLGRDPRVELHEVIT